MSSTSRWPGGVFLSFGLWFDQVPEGGALAAVGDVLEERGGTYSGAMFFGPADAAFVRVLDIAGIGYSGAGSARSVRRGLRDGIAYRVAMQLPGAGPAALSYEATPGESAPAARHPVDVTVQAGPLSIPRELWNADEQAAAEKQQAVVLDYLRACCTALDPAYAVLHSEGSTPTPAALHVGRQIGVDVYVSRRLGLGAHLSQAARLSETFDWGTGVFYSGGFLAETPDRDALLAAWTRPSLIIGEQLAARAAR
ncbi:hypothetical protein [Actinoplanes sp. URMC 104]|uniref:hypothetical protein n=1 Tax=Actinoplanes sp. URMC 104 TaxID=3423409 RepID=UPI003F1BCFBB